MFKKAAPALLLWLTVLVLRASEPGTSAPAATAPAPTAPAKATTVATPEVAVPSPVTATSVATAPAELPFEPARPARAAGVRAVVYVIPVHGEINKPVLYIIRRGLKEAIDQKADAVVLDMSTPGGALDVTFDIMEALGKFPGETLTYVDHEAMSAGAFISGTTGEIWFAPDAVIGAAAPVSSSGQDIDATMKQKVVSYLKARVRAISEGKGYRGQVISAMIDADFELKIGDTVIKSKGELLSLTASEASKTYGEPPHALLAAGIARDIDALLTKKFGAGGYAVKNFEVTWSERLAQYLTGAAPVLLGLGLLALFVEFKMPGHGWIGGIGVLLLGLVFFGHFVAGLSGHEPVLFFALGLLMLAVEIFFLPGVMFLAVTGIILMLGSLLWSMADIWPNEPISVSGDALIQPLGSLGLGLGLAVVAGAVLIRFLPRGWMWDKLVLGATVGSTAQAGGGAPGSAAGLDSLVGRRGLAVTALRPGGQIEIDGRRFEAKVEVGAIDAGTAVLVRGRSDFSLVVEPASS
jgi:membrane-bound serine protease (ClpP class)